jgi:hypothetical protein
MNLGDNPLLTDVAQKRRTIQFMMYAQFLCGGGTYHFKHVQKATIDKYLLAAATLVSSVTGFDPRKDNPADKGYSQQLTAVLEEYKRWDKMPNRREPWTPELQRNLDRHVTLQKGTEFDLLEVLSDFTATGLYTGCRISEYAQSSLVSRPVGRHAVDRFDQSPVAFTLNDISFFKVKGAITHETIMACTTIDKALAMVDVVELTWTTQKNGVRGEKKTFFKNSKCTGLCPVYRFLRIVRRFLTLMGHRTDLPISVYRDPHGKLFNITRKDIDDVLQATAVRQFRLVAASDTVTISKWSSHSIRVGACNILFGAGVKDHVIQFRLRWRSMAFMDYFRNIGAISQEQTNAVNLAIEQPELFY